MQWGLNLLLVLVLSDNLKVCCNSAYAIEQFNVNGQDERPQAVMSVWARKAGGKFRSEFLIPQSVPPTSSKTIIDTEEDISVGETVDNFTINSSSKEFFRPVKVPQIELINELSSSFETSATAGQNSQLSVEENDNDNEYGEEGRKCPNDHFWHIRGLRCVPFYCPEGNSYRNIDTGLCLSEGFGAVGFGSFKSNTGGANWKRGHGSRANKLVARAMLGARAMGRRG